MALNTYHHPANKKHIPPHQQNKKYHPALQNSANPAIVVVVVVVVVIIVIAIVVVVVIVVALAFVVNVDNVASISVDERSQPAKRIVVTI